MSPALMNNKNLERGVSTTEILIVAFIISIALVSLSGLAAFSLKNSASIKDITAANKLAEETIEAVRSFRDATTWDSDGLGVITLGDIHPHYPNLAGGPLPAWTLPEGTETLGSFERKVVFEEVSRDLATKNIEPVYNSSHDDPDTRKATVTIYWGDSGSKVASIVAYLTNWK